MFFLEGKKAVIIGTIWLKSDKEENTVFLAPVTVATQFLSDEYKFNMAAWNSPVAYCAMKETYLPSLEKFIAGHKDIGNVCVTHFNAWIEGSKFSKLETLRQITSKLQSMVESKLNLLDRPKPPTSPTSPNLRSCRMCKYVKSTT